MAKAVVILEAERGGTEGMLHSLHGRKMEPSFAHIEVLGYSVLRRAIERLIQAGVHAISVFTNQRESFERFDDLPGVVVAPSENPWRSAAERIQREMAVLNSALVIMNLDAYIEFDPVDALQFRDRCEGAIVRGCDDRGALGLWVADPSRISADDLYAQLHDVEWDRFPIRGYVNRLENPCDLRRLAVDSLSAKCQLQPRGFEVRPGIWMGDGAQVEKGARLVAPSFIGRGVRISPQALITRCSNVECDSIVDYGTVVEDTTVLPNSYVGIGLDLSHSIVDGSTLLNLQHRVTLTITDSAVIRRNKPAEVKDSSRHFQLWTNAGFGEPIQNTKKNAG